MWALSCPAVTAAEFGTFPTLTPPANTLGVRKAVVPTTFAYKESFNPVDVPVAEICTSVIPPPVPLLILVI